MPLLRRSRAMLLCCFGSSVPNHAAIYCGDSELLHHIPEQLSNERYTDKWQRRTHSSGVTGHGTHLPLRGFKRFGRRIDLRVKTGSEAIRALAMQIPAFRQKLSDGWYQYALPGVMQVKPNCLPVLMSRWCRCVIHIVPQLAGAKSGGVFQCWGRLLWRLLYGCRG